MLCPIESHLASAFTYAVWSARAASCKRASGSVTLSGSDVKRYALANMRRLSLSDEDAKKEGLPGQLVPGNLSMALFSRMITDWNPDASLVRLSATFRFDPSHIEP